VERIELEGESRVLRQLSRLRVPAVSSGRDPGVGRAIREATRWLCRAQDHSASADGGVASHFCLREGWATSYPETTGYIVPTMLECARRLKDDSLRERARRMLDWLVSTQREDGSFQGGRVGTEPIVPVTFNTGQILIGLAAGADELGTAYDRPMHRAAEWLATTQDDDGGWSRFPSPLTAPGAKSYEIHTSMGLFAAARVAKVEAWSAAALASVDWALGLQRESGWFEACDHARHDAPLTHTIGYTLRTVLEAYLFSGRRAYLDAARSTAEGLLTVMRKDGFIPGRLADGWHGTVQWACLTGTSQISECWLILHEQTGEPRYRDAALTANRYVRRTLRPSGSSDVRGGVFGSLPADGGYCRNQVLSWATKFFLNTQLREEDLLDG
jgi:hypothetical protein